MLAEWMLEEWFGIVEKGDTEAVYHLFMEGFVADYAERHPEVIIFFGSPFNG